MKVSAVDHIVLNVADVGVSADWYARVLGMRRADATPPAGGRVRTSMIFGTQKLNLRPIEASQNEWFTANHPMPGSEDLCFLVDAAPEAVVEHLTACGVSVELGPVTKHGARGPIHSVYCRDPDGSLIELASYISD